MRIIRPTCPDEQHQALALLMARPDSTPQQIDVQIETLRAYAQSYGLSLQHCLIAADGHEFLAASLCVDSPGRIASIFLPAAPAGRTRDACRLLVQQLAEQARARGIVLLQAMLEPDSSAEASLLSEAGFVRVARLLYLERDLALALPPVPARWDLSWESYTSAAHDLFKSVLQATYEASLDCPALNGRRRIDDVLASHRAAGRFDPRGWMLARHDGEPVGLVLVNAFPERMASEVIYMGVLTKFRHRGCGAALLRRAIGIARDQGSLTLALCVDENNVPARRLYDAFGFQQTAVRDAWICFLDSTGPQSI